MFLCKRYTLPLSPYMGIPSWWPVKVPAKEPIRHPWRVETYSGRPFLAMEKIGTKRKKPLGVGWKMMIPKVDCFLRDFLGKLHVFLWIFPSL